MELKEKMSSVLEDISKNNKDFVSQSKGEFATAFESMSNNFGNDMAYTMTALMGK